MASRARRCKLVVRALEGGRMTLPHAPTRPWRIVARAARTVLAALTLAACNSDKGTGPTKPTKLWFTTRSSVGTAGVPIAPAIQVAILDADGDTVTNAITSVTITLGRSPAGAALSGTATVNTIHGIATFTDLSLDKASDGYALAASSGSLLPDTTPLFSIGAASPATLAFTAPPNTTGATAVLAPVRVEIRDPFRNTVTRATSAVTVTLGANTAGGTLSGTTTVNAINGVATFADLSIDKTGAGYALTASSDALTAVTSPAFNIDAPPLPAKIAFTASPTGATAGAPISPPVRVAIQDATGATVTTATNAVTVALGANPTGATLSGTLTTNAVRGVATFSDLSVNNAGQAYTLTASSGALGNASSTAF